MPADFGNIIRRLDKVSDDFNVQIEGVFTRYAAGIDQVYADIQAGTAGEGQILVADTQNKFAEALFDAGYEEEVLEFLEKYGSIAEEVQTQLVRQGFDPTFNAADLGSLKELQRVDFSRFEQLGTESVQALSSGLIKAATGGAPSLRTFVKDFREKLAKFAPEEFIRPNLRAQAFTLANTTLSEFQRTVTLQLVAEEEEAGEVLYDYLGPGPDAIIRPWCRLHLGKRLNLEQIQALPPSKANDSKDNLIGCGGWNCRHAWFPARIVSNG